MSSSIPRPLPTIHEIFQLYRLKGHRLYDGESVTQLEHAIQCAVLAEQANASPAMILACLLHDIGHLLHDFGENAVARGIDDRHEYRAVSYLRSLLPLPVTEPIRLHVQAKRYLCTREPEYWTSLSSLSRQSLELQGGPFSPAEAATFIAEPYAPAAVQLRRWDEQAKRVGLTLPEFDRYLPLMQQCALCEEA